VHNAALYPRWAELYALQYLISWTDWNQMHRLFIYSYLLDGWNLMDDTVPYLLDGWNLMHETVPYLIHGWNLVHDTA
jgi:hypothetical protein